jgi:chemotaxis protein methyltransferase CheR
MKHIFLETVNHLIKYPNENIKIWSAASSTGQEAFSILMSLAESLDQASFSKISINGSDISTEALKKANLATYNGLDVQRGLPISLLMKYFTQVAPETWKVNSDLTVKAQFQEFNLLTGFFPKSTYHVIFCRNVLIYQNIENKKVILENIYDALKPGGILFLGAGESLIGIQSKFERMAFDQGTVYRKN